MPEAADTLTHACQVLEFDALLALIAGYAAGELGRARVLRWRPEARAEDAVAGHPLLAELLALHQAGHTVPQPQVPPLDPLLRSVAPEGAVVPGEELVACRSFLDVVLRLRAFAERLATGEVRDVLAACRPPGAPSCLRQILAQLESLPDLHRSLQRALDERGQVLDDASPRLRELRRDCRVLESRIQRQLEQILRRVEADDVLRESYVTFRNGRLVIPVKREARNRLTGVIHDHSDTGHTLFVEPAETLPLGNELSDLRLEERDEVRRILAQLCTAVRQHSDVLRGSQDRLATWDAAVAVARWAQENDCVLPRFARRLQLRRARHPLLLHRMRREGRANALVPVDVALAPEVRVLLVTGPNSGGKTAVLKTVGLLTLAAQAGLPVPVAADSDFRFFEQVFADIGDEQSLLSDLSTFTGHLTRIREILAQVTRGVSLVLLDEVGAGTDPLEGGALACAVLSRLAGEAGVTLATTHLGAVKTYVHEQEHMVNAAVRFNPDTLTPEYTLEVGHPGPSQALAIAARVGLPAEVIAAARGMLSSDYLRLENMLSHIEEDERQASQREQEIEETARGLAGERERLREELARLKAERRRLLHEAYTQADGIVQNARREMERLLQEVRVAESADAQRERARQLRERVAERERHLAEGRADTAPRPLQPLPLTAVRPGQEVWVERLRGNARVVSVAPDQDRVTVQVGALRFDVASRDIGRRDESAGTSAPAPLPETRPRTAEAVAPELMLVGKRVDEALPVLDRFLDRAAVARLPEVRIVHGFGTGRLQEAVHGFLKGNPLVARFRLGRATIDPGGAGVTWVDLRRD